MSHQRLWFFLIIGIFLFLGAGVLMLSWPSLHASEQQQSRVSGSFVKFLGRPDFGGEFTLVNQDGVLTGSATFKDTYKLIYFGFTYCPDVCPTTLKKITDILHILNEEEAGKILPVMISIDPERDTPEVIKSYISSFHPRFVGFTGQQGQIDDVLGRYRVFAQKTQDNTLTDYQMDHTSFIYLSSPDDRVIAVFTPTQSAKDIAVSLRKILY